MGIKRNDSPSHFAYATPFRKYGIMIMCGDQEGLGAGSKEISKVGLAEKRIIDGKIYSSLTEEE